MVRESTISKSAAVIGAVNKYLSFWHVLKGRGGGAYRVNWTANAAIR